MYELSCVIWKYKFRTCFKAPLTALAVARCIASFTVIPYLAVHVWDFERGDEIFSS